MTLNSGKALSLGRTWHPQFENEMRATWHNRKSTLISVVAIAVAAGWFASTMAHDKSASSGIVYLDHEKVDRAFAKGGTLIAGRSGQAEYRVVTARKDGPTDAESHDLETDVIYVVDGNATVIIDGTLVAPRVISPGENRAQSVEGGTPYSLSKGDVMIIPAGVSHWFKVPQPPFLYFIVKVH